MYIACEKSYPVLSGDKENKQDRLTIFYYFEVFAIKFQSTAGR